MSGASLAGNIATLSQANRKSPVSFFEFWPDWLFYTPVVMFWVLNAIRYRSMTLPSLANPRINAGGICGESKNAILDLAGPAARAWVADYASFTVCGHADGDDLHRALKVMEEAGLGFPVVAKPDMSCNGVGVRVMRDQAQLDSYLRAFPRGTEMQLQNLVPYEGEAGLFYIRHPDEPTGRITSVTLKFPPIVVGDGRHTVKELIGADERLNAISHLLLPKLGDRAALIPAPAERVALVFVGNHCRGSTFKDGLSIVTPALTARIDEIMHDMPEVYFSRIDLRYESLEALREGRGFKIIEFNGSGSEATHIWDPEMTLRRAYADQFFHYGESFRIGAKMRETGLKPVGALKLLALWRHQKRLMRAYPVNE
ncbi:D-alanine--D-alanine ligase [Acidocella sp.]|uniref:D-alanine--D-alanine ligase n=1 Tax=Acidocella sp. TaxID=50710 RepID=UPI003CFCCBC0